MPHAHHAGSQRSPRLLLIALACAATSVWAQDTGLHGDIGLAAFRVPSIAATDSRATQVLPYVDAQWGRWFGRVDTFGWRAMPLAAGHLELATRLTFEGFTPRRPGVDRRRTTVPIGAGTLQETRVGAFLLYAFADPVSHGALADMSYAVEWKTGPLSFYPQAGLEVRSAKYVRQLYGISAAEAARTGLTAYQPGASRTPYAAVTAQWAVTPAWSVTGQVRRRWLDDSLTASPLVDRRTQTTAFLALSRTFP